MDCRSSGMSVRGWCAEHNDASTKTYYHWEKEILSSAAGELKIILFLYTIL